MTVPSTFKQPLVFPPELRAKYPLPERYAWDDEHDAMMAAVVKNGAFSPAYFLLYDEFTVHDVRKESSGNSDPLYKTLGLEDSMRLIQALILFGD